MADLPPGANRMDATSFVSWWPPHATGMGHLNGFESFPLHKKLYPSHSRRVQFLVRERGLDDRFAPVGQIV